jgi:hypothetical protein
MRLLTIDAAAKARATKIAAYAEAHPYRPGGILPGSIPELVGQFDTYRAVFSITHADGLVFRHLSISVPGDKLPNVMAVCSIADLFGFTGWSMSAPESIPDGWQLGPHKEDRCVVVAQLLGSDIPKQEQN